MLSSSRNSWSSVVPRGSQLTACLSAVSQARCFFFFTAVSVRIMFLRYVTGGYRQTPSWKKAENTEEVLSVTGCIPNYTGSYHTRPSRCILSTSSHCFFWTHFNNILPYTPRSLFNIFPSGSCGKLVFLFIMSSMRATNHANFVHLG